ncbi:hypothetical protein [Shewanella waksmanii]|uniref:hypothetical protein n=1 Tax=Shewanella waksmanii TaxID=213783 RepID=UPI000686CD1B|nr:hypothetical protein [Shewanella waksmanii]
MIKNGLLFFLATFFFTMDLTKSPTSPNLHSSSYHLGFNNASAIEDKMYDEDEDEDDMERFEVLGQEWDDYWDDWDDNDWEEDGWNDDHWDEDDWDVFEDNQEELELSSSQQCIIDAHEDRRYCRNTANALAVTGATLCLGFAPNVVAIGVCEGANAVAHDDALSQCDIELEKQKVKC